MKRYYSKFRIFLLMLTLGLSSVPFFNCIYEKWTEVRVNLPQVQSETPIFVFPGTPPPPFSQEITKEDLIQDRDLSLYEVGNDFSNCFNYDPEVPEFRKCQDQLSEARDFIFSHWKEKKRGHIIYGWSSSCDADGDTYIFIEPDSNGEWHIILRDTGDVRYPNLKQTVGYSLKFKRRKEEAYPFKKGTYFLSVRNKKGKEIEGF